MRLPAARGVPLGERTTSRDNNFDVLRLAAALLVVVSHSWALTQHAEPRFAGDSLGGLGVTIFFGISGFLVARSWHADPRPHAFAIKRFLRLWPALLVVVGFCALVLGPLVTDRTSAAYFTSPATGRYVLHNMRLDVVYGLPGVFTDNPQPLAVNGSLWTLPIEVKAYIMLLVLGLGGLLRRPWVLALAIGVLAWVLASSSAPPHPISDWLEGSLQTGLVVVFTGGALLYALRDTIRLDWRLAAAAALAAWLTRHGDDTVRSVAWALTIPYLLVFVAYRTTPALRALVKPGDLSYGIYLWAYPVQQTIVHALGPDISPGWLLLLSAGISYAIALASWRLVEAPVLRLKRRLSVKPVPRPTVAVP